jgi:uncharacterized phosphosugar-binding protein
MGLNLMILSAGTLLGVLADGGIRPAHSPLKLLAVGSLMGLAAGFGLLGITLSARCGLSVNVINTTVSLTLAVPIVLSLSESGYGGFRRWRQPLLPSNSGSLRSGIVPTNPVVLTPTDTDRAIQFPGERRRGGRRHVTEGSDVTMSISTKTNIAQQYHQQVQTILGRIIDTQVAVLEQAAALVADTIQRDGLIYTLGSGHSLMVAAELYFRAGGMPHFDVIHDRTFGRAERLSGYAAELLDSYPIGPNDLLIIVSNSGRNPLPVEMATEARQRRIFTVGITSLGHSNAVESRAPGGLRLFEACDLVIDTCGLPGDAAIEIAPGNPIRVCPTSTLVGIFIVNCISGMAAQKILEKGTKPPVFLSANLDGADEHNRKLLDFMRARIRGL